MLKYRIILRATSSIGKAIEICSETKAAAVHLARNDLQKNCRLPSRLVIEVLSGWQTIAGNSGMAKNPDHRGYRFLPEIIARAVCPQVFHI